MRLHALILALAVFGAHAASIPDKKDIEKKLAHVVKEVLDKDGVPMPVDNAASAQEIIEENSEIKDIENNLRKQPVDIPVKVVIEDVKPIKSEDKKEDNEVSPANESSEIVREEIDLKNPGSPQRMQHDTQNPETFVDSLKNAVFKNSDWKASEQYAQLQKEITTLKESFENKMTELYGSIQEHLNARPVVQPVDEKKEDAIQVRASVRQDSSPSSGGESSTGGSTGSSPSGSGSSGTSNSTNPWGGGPFGGFFQNWATSFQQNLQSLNQTVNSYWSNNSTNSSSTSSSNQCGGGVFGGWGQSNPLAGFGQQQQGSGQAQQSDEPARPGSGIWQTIQQNVQNFIGGGSQPPAGAQSDAQQPAQPNRPVIQAFQNVIQQAGSLFNRPGSEPQPQPAPASTSQEGSNAVPAEVKPDSQKQPDPQQSGPIKQMIASNPVAQGIAGAIQNIQNTILPSRSREEVKNAPDSAAEATKGGFYSNKPSPVVAWSNFVNTLIGTIGAVVNGSTTTISTAVNSAINTIGTNIQGIITTATAPPAAG